VRKFNSFSLIAAGFILSCGLLGAGYLASRMLIQLEKDNELMVKGYAETKVKSDRAVLNLEVVVRGKSLPECYQHLNHAAEHLQALLSKIGFMSDEISSEMPRPEKLFAKDNHGNATNRIDAYDLYQTHVVRTAKVDLIVQALPQLQELLSEGIEINIHQPDYFISDLERYKLSLIAQATDNAKQRAQALAAGAGGKIAKLLAARQGVFQITSPDSEDISDSGIYDTKSLVKNVRLVVTLKFRLK